MDPGRQDIRASYTIHADEENTQDIRLTDKGTRLWLIVIGAFLGVITLALLFTIAGLLHADNVNRGQAAQIHALNQANARLAGQLSAQSNQLSGMSAKVAAADPSADTSLITCGDLRRMGLTVTTGGNVSSVPGTVSLSQSPVKLPGHCSARG
jgi:hypothetical protein